MATWKEVAIALGERLSYQASCPEEDAAGNRLHVIATDYPNCPFCADRVAYQMYVNKMYVGKMKSTSTAKGRGNDETI